LYFGFELADRIPAKDDPDRAGVQAADDESLSLVNEGVRVEDLRRDVCKAARAARGVAGTLDIQTLPLDSSR